MKIIYILFFSLFAINSNAQIFETDTIAKPSIDSSKIKVTITLKAEHHFLIVDCLEGVNKSEWASYAFQVAKGMDTFYRPAKLINVTLESGMVADLYFQMCAQQERYSASLNIELRNTLVPQIKSYTWLFRELQNINTRNNEMAQQRKLRGFNMLKQIQ